MSESKSELKNIIEAALFASEEPLSVSKLINLFPEQARPLRTQVSEALTTLIGEFEDRGIEIRRVSGGYRVQTRNQYAPWVRQLFAGRAPRYSRALLETLAIIAYRQPVTRGDIEEIRGVSVSSDIIRHLMERNWIKEVGRRDVPGHPVLLATTKEFLAYFNLRSLNELPALMDKRDTFEIARELNLQLPLNGEQNDDGDGGGLDDGQPGHDDSGLMPFAESATVPARDEVVDSEVDRKTP